LQGVHRDARFRVTAGLHFPFVLLMANPERSEAAPLARGPSISAPRITPVFPLFLLEAMRDRDRPEEVLEAEDLTASMPRRLGLSEVVRVQIQRFQEAVKQRRPQGAAQVEDLVRLVVRRSDAEDIFREAGRRIAMHVWNERPSSLRRALRFAPGPVSRMTAQRAGRRLFRQLTDGPVTVSRWPSELRIPASLTARADPSGRACAFYAGAFGELLRQYTRREYRVLHPECDARGGTVCRWVVEIVA
jgi:predicted hydrocarbon binding protein